MKPNTLPDSPGYSSVIYDIEKQIGDRLPTGQKPLKELKPIHYSIIEYHLRGYNHTEIAAILDKEVSYATIVRVLADPLAKAFIDTFHDVSRMELFALRRKANDALRKGLDSEHESIALRASRTFFEVAGDLKEAGKGNKTAEDVVSQIINQINIQINANPSEA